MLIFSILKGPVLSALFLGLTLSAGAQSSIIFEETSPYHHVRVRQEGDMRTLCFDDATETRMSIENPLLGHFEYTEYFHMPWLWNTNIQNVLMLGLGGGSTQQAYEHYYPQVKFETVEIDPLVLRVAKQYFKFQEGDHQKVFVEDGRVFLRRSTSKYDAILLDAYVSGRYGSAIPQHLATKEFFEIVRSHLTTNGVVAYNVIGSLGDWHADIVGAIYKTLKTVFPQVYFFPAESSRNVVLVATCSPLKMTQSLLRFRGALFAQSRKPILPHLRDRWERFESNPPRAAASSPVLTDDYAPVEGLAGK